MQATGGLNALSWDCRGIPPLPLPGRSGRRPFATCLVANIVARFPAYHTRTRFSPAALPPPLPRLQNVFQTSYLMGYLFLTPLIYLAIMLPYTEYSKKLTRRNPTGWWARKMQW